uniref:Uncharacterized protein n=1 Tax=Opuntia streptacantha TaxID=393608 RepID=A0A7C9D0U2_OPUST
MSIASLQQSFLKNALIIPTQKPKPRVSSPLTVISCKYPKTDHHTNHNDPSTSRRVEKELAKLAIVTLAAGVLTLGSVGDHASAAPSGGRVGGQAFRSAEPRASSPRVNSRQRDYAAPNKKLTLNEGKKREDTRQLKTTTPLLYS